MFSETRGYPVVLLVPVLASFSIESMKNEKETCCYRNINYCDFDGRGNCVAKERKEIESVTESGTEFEITFIFLINKNVSKLQIILMSLSFKAEKKGKKARKEKRSWFTAGKKAEHCDTRTCDVIRRNFEKSSSREINL